MIRQGATNKILYGVVLFAISYPIFLTAWIWIKPFYGSLIGNTAIRLSAFTTGVRIDKINIGKEKSHAKLSKPVATDRGMADVFVDLSFSISSYTFNVPLTLALIAALYPIAGWRLKNFIEALAILAAIHLLYVYSYCTYQTLLTISKYGGQKLGTGAQLFWEFLWSFTDNMVIRFEPFLIAFYLWLRGGHKIAFRRGAEEPDQK